MASGRIFLLCETGREENLRFLLLRLIDINIKYSGVVLIRLWFSSRSREEKKKRKKRKKIFSWTRIFLAKIFCLHPPHPLPPLRLPWLQRPSSAFWGAKQPASTRQPPPPLAWQAGRPGSAKPGRYFFQKRHLAPWQPHKQLCWQPGLAGVCRVFRLTLSHRHDVLSARLGPSCLHPSRGWGHRRAPEGSAPCLPTGFDTGDPPGLHFLPTGLWAGGLTSLRPRSPQLGNMSHRHLHERICLPDLAWTRLSSRMSYALPLTRGTPPPAPPPVLSRASRGFATPGPLHSLDPRCPTFKRPVPPGPASHH